MSDVDSAVTASKSYISQLVGPAFDSIGVACTPYLARLFAEPVIESLDLDDLVNGSPGLEDSLSARRFSGIGSHL